ncbi:YetF domain-containing protein [Peribacillus sp. SCS-37]|uniref:YetF domain-containing protein n=1 Tax=Paraperibacillus esterisolvens TaxID=3115296 RepID=UPI00390639AE
MIENGNINKEAMRKTGCTLDILEAMLREKDTFNLRDVEKAVFEINGTLSVLKKEKFLPLNRKDLENIGPKGKYPMEIIIGGRWALNGETPEEELKKVNIELLERGKSVHDIEYAAIGSNGRLFILPKEE